MARHVGRAIRRKDCQAAFFIGFLSGERSGFGSQPVSLTARRVICKASSTVAPFRNPSE